MIELPMTAIDDIEEPAEMQTGAQVDERSEKIRNRKKTPAVRKTSKTLKVKAGEAEDSPPKRRRKSRSPRKNKNR